MTRLWMVFWGALSAAFAGLLMLLKIRTGQRNKAQEKAQVAENKAATVVKVKEVQTAITQARQQAAKRANEVQSENIKNSNLPPVGDFGDKRLRKHKD